MCSIVYLVYLAITARILGISHITLLSIACINRSVFIACGVHCYPTIYQMFIVPWGSVTVFPCGSFDCLWLLSRKVTTWELPAVSPLPPTQASSVAADLTKQNAPQTGTRIPWSAILILYLKFDSPNTSSQDIIYWPYLFIVLNCTTIWKGLLSF